MQRFLIYFLFIGLCALAVLAGRHAGQRDEALKVIREVIATTCAQGGTQVEIARQFGISQSHVSDLRSGRKWSWLDVEHLEGRG
jgi:Na+-transporting NADH:ubiquinone oxidoreductase subunit NqrE